MALKLSLQLQLFLVLLVFIAAAPHVITARDLHIHKSSTNIKGIQDVKIYLQRYGYLTSNVEITNNAFDDELESALKTFQKNYKLNVSGILDKETLTLMSQPRCGCPDTILNTTTSGRFHSYFTFFSGSPKWPESKYHLTYAFLNDFPTEFMAPVRTAMELWGVYSKFTFSPSARPQSADITLSFVRGNHGDNYPFDGQGGALAHAFGPPDGRVHFDAAESWAVGEVGGSFNVEMVAMHELGHVLGLGHSTVQSAIMWPYMNSGVSKTIQFDDIRGIQTLYS